MAGLHKMKEVFPACRNQAGLASLVFVLVTLLISTCSGASTNEVKVKPAQLKISGFGLLGNLELKRVLRTLEFGQNKPATFGASFIEDAALILTSRVKRDGYLQPTI